LILISGALKDAKDQKIAAFGSSYKGLRAPEELGTIEPFE
jgi:hypothetical protein